MSNNTNTVRKSDLDKRINALAKAGTTLREQATILIRETASWCMSPEASENCQPLAEFVQALLNLNHRGMAQKAIHWIEDATPFKLAPDTAKPTFRKRKNSTMQIRNDGVWHTDFTNYTREAPKKAAWSLEEAIKKAIAKAVRDKVLDERSARVVASNAALGYTSKQVEVGGKNEGEKVDGVEAPKTEHTFVQPQLDVDAA